MIAPAHAPTPWNPCRDFRSRWPLVATWPGLRSEVRAAWLTLATIAPEGSPRFAVALADLMQQMAASASAVNRRLARLAALGLVVVDRGGLAGRPTVVVEMVDPLGLERLPVGPARRSAGPPPRERQLLLFEAPVDELTPPPVVLPAPRPASPEVRPVPSTPPIAPASIASPARPLPPPTPTGPITVPITAPNSPPPPAGQAGPSTKAPGSDPVDFHAGRLTSTPAPATDAAAIAWEAHRAAIVEAAKATAAAIFPGYRPGCPGTLAAGDRDLILKASALAIGGPYDRAWLDDAVRATNAGRRARPGGYLYSVLKRTAAAAGRDLNRDLARVIVPDDLAARDPAPRPSKALDQARAWGLDGNPAEARSVVRDCLAVLRNRNRDCPAVCNLNPEGPHNVSD